MREATVETDRRKATSGPEKQQTGTFGHTKLLGVVYFLFTTTGCGCPRGNALHMGFAKKCVNWFLAPRCENSSCGIVPAGPCSASSWATPNPLPPSPARAAKAGHHRALRPAPRRIAPRRPASPRIAGGQHRQGPATPRPLNYRGRRPPPFRPPDGHTPRRHKPPKMLPPASGPPPPATPLSHNRERAWRPQAGVGTRTGPSNPTPITVRGPIKGPHTGAASTSSASSAPAAGHPLATDSSRPTLRLALGSRNRPA